MSRKIILNTVKRTLAVACASALLMQSAFCATPNFKDMVAKDHWAYDALCYAYEAGAIKGFEDGTLRPDEHLTRAQMATVIVRLYGKGTKADISKFPDVAEGEWYYAYLEEAVAMGLFKGDSEGNMNPNRDISRAEVFTVICRLLGLEVESGKTDFSDDTEIADWARGYVKALRSKGYISGDGEKRVNAANPITRAEFAKLLYNIGNISGASSASSDGGKAASESSEGSASSEKKSGSSSSGTASSKAGQTTYVVITGGSTNKVKRTDHDDDTENTDTPGADEGKESVADDIFDDLSDIESEIIPNNGLQSESEGEAGKDTSDEPESIAEDIFDD